MTPYESVPRCMSIAATSDAARLHARRAIDVRTQCIWIELPEPTLLTRMRPSPLHLDNVTSHLQGGTSPTTALAPAGVSE